MNHRSAIAVACAALAVACMALAAACVPTGRAHAAGFHTPLAWQQRVTGQVDSVFVGQRKNTTWIRDENHNFVDDLIDAMHPDSVIGVILDFNRPLSDREIRMQFGSFGQIQHVSQILTAALLSNVQVGRTDSLALSPVVAMVEWQPPIRLAVAYSTREIQARANTSYPTYSSSAQSRSQTGTGVGIAILDTGIDEGHESIPPADHGFDATIFEDTNGNGTDDSREPAPLGNGSSADSDDEPGTGGTNPNPCVTLGGITTCQKHGTYVAGIALGRGINDPTDKCAGLTTPIDENLLVANCTGVATGASLTDVRVCPGDASDCANTDVTEGLEWLAVNAASLGIRVANLSFVVCADDDPSGMLPALVDYVASKGIVVVAGHGNRDKCTTHNPSCDPSRPNRRTIAPGSAAMALSVAATNDLNTINRDDDVAYSAGLEGPRCTTGGASVTRADLKPDLSAPGEGIWTAKAGTVSGYEPMEGTSLAAPHVAGAAAILLGANPAMDAASACDQLMRTADPPTASTPYDSGLDPTWDRQFGMGIVNVDAALAGMNAGDVAFSQCTGDPGSPGRPCALASPLSPWENDIDITTDIYPPVADVPNTIHAYVVNRGGASAQVDVDFGVYIFGTGTHSFYHIGRQRRTIASGAKEDFAQPWTPESDGHQCAQVAIRYGPDTIFWNNVTQRNMTILPAGTMSAAPGSGGRDEEIVYASTSSKRKRTDTAQDVLVENVFLKPATFRVQADPSRQDLPCTAKPERFRNDPAVDMPQVVRVSFPVPTKPGAIDRADCRVAVYGTPAGSQRETLVGGVTLRAIEPKSCEIQGVVVDSTGSVMSGVRVACARALRPGTIPFERVARTVTTGSSGTFRSTMESGIPYRIRLSTKSSPPRDFVISPVCGSSPVRLVYVPELPPTAGMR